VYNLPLQNNWTGEIHYQKINEHGVIGIVGRVSLGTNAVGTVIGTLPAGFRPFTNMAVNLLLYHESTGTIPNGRLIINSNGNIVVAQTLDKTGYVQFNTLFNADY